ncbi:MAG TPA: glycosyltransferase family 4 protein [Longimicrobiaceae bacterium]|nr:glycosyltransferase family 4 protein [Longimicrobiaceae bacterium]
MRLLVVNWQDRLNPRAGGAEIHLHETFRRLACRGHRVTLLVSGWRGAARREVVDGMEVHRVGSRHTFPLLAAAYHRRVLRAERFDVVVEDLNKVPLLAPLWAGAPVVLLVHHLFGEVAFHGASLPVALATRLLERSLPRFYRGIPVQAVSESTADDLARRGLDRRDVRVIYNGVDTGRYAPDPAVPRAPEPTLLYLGRLQRYKRVDLVLRAVAHMRRNGLRVRLVVAGTGAREGALRRLAGRLGIGDRVEFTGYVDEARKLQLLRTAWVHVLTSPKEGWGITVMEAAACGTPTVGSSSPGLWESVVHRTTGILVPHGDATDLAAVLADLLADRDRLEAMGRAARRYALGFSWDRTADRTEAHLAGIGSSPGAGCSSRGAAP